MSVVRQPDRSARVELHSFDDLLASSSVRHRADEGGWEPPDDLVRSVVDKADSLRMHQAIGVAAYTIGIEVLAHRLVGVLVNVHGDRLGDEQLLIEEMTVDAVVAGARTIAASLRRSLPQCEAASIILGVQLGAPVDADTGRVLFYKKMPGKHRMEDAIQWKGDEPLGPLLEEATGLRTIISNDADAYATFELWFGAGRQTDRFALMLVREGVGGSLVINGKVFDGPMELGNLSVFPESQRSCDCGSVGCLETTGGIYGILESIHGYTGRRLDSIGAAAELANDPDVGQKICSAFTAAGYAHAKGIGVIINIARPRKVVLYAPVAMVEPTQLAAKCFLEQVRQFPRYCHKVFGDCELVVEPIPPFAGAHGAALIALNRHFGMEPTSSAWAEEGRAQ